MTRVNDETEQRVGFRDIYNAVGDSEKRIKEHVSLALLPLSMAMADHETRIRLIEEKGSNEAREAMAKAEIISIEHEELVRRVDAHDKRFAGQDSAGVERRRLGDLSGRALGIIILASNFVLGLLVFAANILTEHPVK